MIFCMVYRFLLYLIGESSPQVDQLSTNFDIVSQFDITTISIGESKSTMVYGSKESNHGAPMGADFVPASVCSSTSMQNFCSSK